MSYSRQQKARRSVERTSQERRTAGQQAGFSRDDGRDRAEVGAGATSHRLGGGDRYGRGGSSRQTEPERVERSGDRSTGPCDSRRLFGLGESSARASGVAVRSISGAARMPVGPSGPRAHGDDTRGSIDGPSADQHPAGRQSCELEPHAPAVRWPAVGGVPLRRAPLWSHRPPPTRELRTLLMHKPIAAVRHDLGLWDYPFTLRSS